MHMNVVICFMIFPNFVLLKLDTIGKRLFNIVNYSRNRAYRSRLRGLLPGSILLSNRLEKHNRHGGGQVQTPRSMHRNGEAMVDVRGKQLLR